MQRAAGTFQPHFELLHYHVDVETDGDGQTTTEATVKLRIGDEVRHEVAEGDGPVNALDAALRKALNGHFPNLRDVQLVDYKVRVINSDAGTAAGRPRRHRKPRRRRHHLGHRRRERKRHQSQLGRAGG